MSLRVLALTSQFGYPWDPVRAMFNQQQFDRLALRVELTVLVPVAWTEVLRHPGRFLRARSSGRERWPYVDYFVSFHVPGAFRSLNAAFMLVSALLQRPRLLLAGRWDCLLGSWLYPDAVALVAIAALRGAPVLAKAHGSDVNVYTRRPLRRAQIRWAMNRCSAVMTASDALARRLHEIGVDAHRTAVVYNGIDARIFHPPRAGEPATREPLVLFVGNLLRTKGCHELLDAFASVARTDPRVRLELVGDGPERAALAARIEALGLRDRVVLAGKVPHGRLGDAFRRAMVLCLPSHAEGVPNVVLESMACGTPVVATRVGGIPEVLPRDAGLMVPVGDVEALAGALREALDRDWSAPAIAAHAGRFDWDRNVDTVVGLIAAAGDPEARTRQESGS